MSLILNNCVEYDEIKSVCTASENGKKYTLNNKSGYRVKKVKVDKCILQGVGDKRCDYLMHLVKNKEQKVFFIEFKGGAMTEAVQQIHDTIVYLKNEFKGCEFNARIVGTKDVPNMESTPHYRKLVRLVGINRIKRATNKVFIENI